MGRLSTHVLDTTHGVPARDLTITLTAADGSALGGGVTDADGRISPIGPEHLPAGDYTLTFETGAWFAARGVVAFYPSVSITFTVADAEAHHHVPLLLNPFGYSTYRGS